MRVAGVIVNGKLISFVICMFFIIYIINTFKEFDGNNASFQAVPDKPLEPLWQQSLDFNKLNFSNETGNPTGCYIVPNHVHYVHFGGKPISYVQFICILSVYKNQRPEKIVFHYNDKNTFSGKYWETLNTIPEFKALVEFNNIELPSEIFGQPLSEGWQKWHASDITRIKTIMTYGGIFLDNDCYLVKKIDDYRRFEISMNWDEGQYLGSQVIIAHRDARFLKRWLECYKVYDKTKWYYNAGERPTIEVLYKEPELLHRVKVVFGADTKYIFKLLQEKWEGWKDFYIIHLLIGHQYLLKNVTEKATFPVEFTETNIAHYPVTFREMAYDVYEAANLDWPKDRIDT